jgi:hypothetical protein
MVQMTNFVALANGGRGAPPPSFRAKKTRPAFLSDLGSDRSEVPAKREATREMFFKGDPTISNDRLDRRYTQFAEYEKFKNDPTKIKKVEGTTNLFQAATPGGMTLADKANQLSFKFGPKPSEIMSDIGKGIGSIAQGFAEKGTPMMQMAKGLFEKFKDQIPQAGTPSFFNPNDIIGLVNALPQAQRVRYYQLLSEGTPYQKAYEMASGLPFTKFQQMSMGGIATLQ